MPRLFRKSNGMFGKHHSKNTKKKIARTKIGKQRASKTKQKISNGLVKYYSIPAHKQRHSKSMKKLWNNPKMKKFARERRLNQIFPIKDTTIEKILQKELKKRKIKFKKHIKLIGQPDLFIEPNLCIFADGDYYHGNPSLYKSTDHIIGKTFVKDVWKRDKFVTKKLKKQGYKVLRFWGSTIKNNLDFVITQIKNNL
jgi:G:T-mismatch repair DNA endonuclease (very short patch repair protein)